ncbi:MAG: FHA domain-containing protein [Planctomycetota bacterium]
MAKFTVKEKRKDDIVREGAMLTVGTRSSCAYSISDPMAAEEHCAIHGPGGGNFLVEDLGTSVGTFVDGVATKGRTPIEDGSEIIIGVTRIVAKIDVENDELLLTIKGAFYYDDKKDALAWSRKEVGFGRFRPLSLGNYLAIGAALIALPLCFLGSTSDAVMEPGPTYHDQMSAYHAQLATLGEDAQDCNACHDAFNGTPAGKCMSCHAEDIDVGHHPFYGDANAWEQACVHCHIDHRGQGEMALIAVPAEESCAGCHEADKSMAPTARPVGDRHLVDVPLFYDTFSHEDHYKKAAANGAELDCSSCHKMSEGQTLVDGRMREFIPVDYDACMACHAKDATVALRSETTFTVRWHGTEDAKQKCETCHTKLFSDEMKTSPHTPREYRYEFDSQAHHEFLTARVVDPNGKDACIECHKNGAELQGEGRLKARIFEHQTHSWDVQPGDEAGKLRVSGLVKGQTGRGDCMQCHRELAGAENLGNAMAESYVDDACAECHKPKAPLKVIEAGAIVNRTDFPHSLHQDLAGGCFACHTFPSVEGQIAPNPVTASDIKDCTACHSVHQNIGGDGSMDSGDCNECHREGDPSYFGTTQPKIWKRHADTTFRHMSRGHQDWTAGKRCEECHTEGVWTAKSLAEIHIPKEDEASCRKCHVEQKTRFHWR